MRLVVLYIRLSIKTSENTEQSNSNNMLSCQTLFSSCQPSFVIMLNFSNTVELQWLEHLWNHENMFATRIVRANEY